MVHSFYAGMGGFAIQTDNPGQPKYIPGSPQLSITAQGIAILAEHGHLPDIAESFIEDKSKADNIAKFLVIVQAGWLLVQCIARVATHLPLTFLEIITSAHVICTLLMYLLWMKKPYDIHEPLILTEEWVRPMCAAMWMFSRISTLKHKEGKNEYHEWPEIERMIQVDTQGVAESIEAGRQHPETVDRTIPVSAQVTVNINDPTVELSRQKSPVAGEVVFDLGDTQPIVDSEPNNAIAGNSTNEHVQILNLRLGQISDRPMAVVNPARRNFARDNEVGRDEVIYQLGLGPKAESHHYDRRNTAYGKIPRWIKPRVKLDLDCIALTRWMLMLSVVRANQPIWDRYKTTYLRQDALFLDKYTISEYPARLVRDNLIDPKIKNWPGKELLGQRNHVIPIAILSLATALYGGLHAAAWYEYFPSSSERHLWRFSSVFIAGSGVTWSALSVIWEVLPNFDISKHWLAILIAYLWFLLLYLACTSAIAIYLFARAFLVFEALYSLRQLPVAAYHTPAFTQYLPHL